MMSLLEFLVKEVSGSSGDFFNVHESMATFLALKGWAIIH